MINADDAAPISSRASAHHVCMVYDDVAEFRARAADFLLEGVVAGDRLQYLGTGSVTELRSALEATDSLAVLVGQLDVRSLDDIYGPDECVDEAATIATYAAATEEAQQHGYRGLRVVAEATSLVRTPVQREVFARYEHLVDRYMIDHGFSAMCAYDRRELGAEAAAEIACLHPEANADATSFRWYAHDQADVGLAGQIDITSHPLFDLTLARTLPLHPGPRLLVDARELEFIDHRGMLALEEHALRQGTQLTLRTDVGVVHRLAGLLRLQAVRLERPA